MLAYSWIFWLAGGVVGVLGLLLLFRSLIGDRSRGRKRCPKCWYDMSGAPGLTCPECGHDARDPRRLLKAHRRWRQAAAWSLVALLGASAVLTPRVARLGIIRAAPRDLLAIGAMFYDTPEASVYQELASRSSSRFSRWVICRRSVSMIAAPSKTQAASPTTIAFAWTQRSDPAEFAVYTLSRMGDQAAPAVPGLIRIATDIHRDSDCRIRCLRALSELHAGQEQSVPAVSILLLSDLEPAIRAQSATTLGELSFVSPQAINALRRSCREDRNDAVVAASIRAIGRFRLIAAAAVPDIQAAMTGRADSVWDEGLRVLNDIGPPAAPAICAATSIQDPQRRDRAIASLGALGADAAVCFDRLLEILRTDTSADCRQSAVIVLGVFGVQAASAEPELARMLRSEPSPRTRHAALDALASFGLTTQVLSNYAAECLDDPDPMVRTLACYRLRTLEKAAIWTLPKLDELVRSGDKAADEAARTIAALKQLQD